ncbi:alpha/beta fold hydrolase [Streptomyces sp. NPDC047043]|uniref:alpha/beta fold hydrolase n=1 Tax=Streptomyces sp. NPDC047043 TaxID=3154497 RepID=UPI0034041229
MTAPDTVVLVHGFWVTPRSWEHWVAHYEKRGLRVLAPAYPGFEAEVESLNADPGPIEQVTVPQIIESLEKVVRGLDRPPVLIGPGGVRFPVTGPVRYTMTASRAVELCGLLRAHTVLPVHYEGWSHFREGRRTVEAELAKAPAEIRERFRWLPTGSPLEVTV